MADSAAAALPVPHAQREPEDAPGGEPVDAPGVDPGADAPHAAGPGAAAVTGRILAVNIQSCGDKAALTWLQGLALVQPEEQARVQRFHFDKDKHRALTGRLLLRYAIASDLGYRPKALLLKRTAAGKPFLAEVGGEAFNQEAPTARPEQSYSFNATHHGDWVVLASLRGARAVGVDITKHERPRGCKTVEEYFGLMQNCFTEREWQLIRNPPPPPPRLRPQQQQQQQHQPQQNMEHEQLRQFYRHWALKESYLKATGEGIGIDLTRIEFSYAGAEQSGGAQAARVAVDGAPAPQWVFTVFHVDPMHCAAVCELRRQVVRRRTPVWLPVPLQPRLLGDSGAAAAARPGPGEQAASVLGAAVTVPGATAVEAGETVGEAQADPGAQLPPTACAGGGGESGGQAQRAAGVVEVLPFVTLVQRLNALNRASLPAAAV